MKLDPRLLRQAISARLALFLTVLAGLIGGILVVLQARQLSKIIAAVFLKEQTLGRVMPLLWLLLGIIFTRSLAVVTGEVSAGAVAVRVKTGLRDLLARHILDLGPGYVAEAESGELSAVLVDGIEALDAYFSQYLPQIVLSALVPLIILVWVFPLDTLTGIVLLLTAPLIPIFMGLIGSASEAATRKQWTILSRMNAFFLDMLQGLSTLKALNRSQAQIQKVAEVSERYRQVTLEVLRITFLSALVLELVATLSTAVVAVEIGLRLLYSRLAFEQAFFILVIAPEFYSPLRQLGARFHAGMNGVAAARRIFEILEMRGNSPSDTEEIWKPVSQAEASVISQELDSGFRITFDNVSYSYPSRQTAALAEISFSIHPGELVALVGESGGGKSSLAQLLLRFVEPTSGQIRINGYPLENIPVEAWRERIAWVPQQPVLFKGTIAENIGLGKRLAGPDAIRQAAMAAHLDEYVLSLPEGYQTQVGERGARLSGGQTQRVALARAFLRSAPLLILDEPTANLDPQQELLLAETTAEICRGRSVLLIAHRLGTVMRADRVLVLEGGRLVESGAPQELIHSGGAFSRYLEASGSAI